MDRHVADTAGHPLPLRAPNRTQTLPAFLLHASQHCYTHSLDQIFRMHVDTWLYEELIAESHPWRYFTDVVLRDVR